MFTTRFPFAFLVATCITFVATAPLIATELGDVMGNVDFNGKPLSSGTITLYRDNGQFTGCKINHGKFRMDSVLPGKLRVTIQGKGVPDKYASEEASVLVVEIQKGKNQFDFSLRD